ncbi:MAG: glycosyltransferase 87 family protein [Hyphomicrobiaceae bacterium]|nr:glycosyltransferase 87 family protein [Hyphomicrobiaceae bacterium]
MTPVPGPGSASGAGERGLLIWWGAVAGVFSIGAVMLVAFRAHFAYEQPLAQIPTRELFSGLFLCGLVYLSLLALVPRSETLTATLQKRLLAGILVVGLGLRLVLLASEPALEDDFHRYLWDGAVTANGLTPYRYAPDDSGAIGTPDRFDQLAEAAGQVHDRINHPDLRTIYPPVAQAAFAVAYLLAPFDLAAWRLVCLAGEVATAGLILALLNVSGRSALWIALYWWNPLIIKEMVNSAHMEAILMPLVTAAVLLVVKERPRASAVALGLAIGTKIWPVILAPILYRHLTDRPAALLAVGAILAGLGALSSLPILLAGLDQTSGFLAYATHWQTNSALTPALTGLLTAAAVTIGLDSAAAGPVARGLMGLVLLAVVLRLAFRPERRPVDIAGRVAVATTALVVLSPAQFPWYLAWAAPFLAVRPLLGMALASALLPAYYASFHFIASGTYSAYRDGWVWVVWLPVWAGLGWDAWQGRRAH